VNKLEVIIEEWSDACISLVWVGQSLRDSLHGLWTSRLLDCLGAPHSVTMPVGE